MPDPNREFTRYETKYPGWGCVTIFDIHFSNATRGAAIDTVYGSSFWNTDDVGPNFVSDELTNWRAPNATGDGYWTT